MPQNRNEVTASAQTGSANAIAKSQSLSGAGALTLSGDLVSGGVAVLGTPGPQQNVVITSAGDDSGLTWTISGTDYAGTPISEELTGGDAVAVTSALLYSTVTSIVGSGATASTVTAGTGDTIYSPWLILGAQRNHYQTNLRAVITGDSATYVVQATSDINIMNQSGGYADDIDSLVASGSSDTSTILTAPWMAVRLEVTAGGPVVLRALESRTA